MENIIRKENKLNSLMGKYGKVIIAFSGGIDSTLVLDTAVKVLGKENVIAAVANSELFTDTEFNSAVKLAKKAGIEVAEVKLNYLFNEEIRNNRPSSWYWMKKIFYKKMNELKEKFSADIVLDGMIMDDNNDFRPGLKARDEEGIVSILQLAQIYKVEVRKLAERRGLENWNKVASCSVSSRFPYNTELTNELINRVMKSEAYLKVLGYKTVRVRVQGNTARIEVPIRETVSLINSMKEINRQLKLYGFEYITLDLEGFKSGRMNDELSSGEKSKLVN
ncbi:ATP-dependent sacrificial sulfur transferase LarE [Lactobacillus sp. UCMA15818]|uniref:ATP-dependent sacrificial sulfur transferase LarE n=1 Tax=Lactobacillaceae TaxID=33958 RepID=UPI0025B262FF|nr:ATP-dependent sacrificial sulfur transferase LarE [Lactobacillus sp. UCMA15818]MDN2454213.1 ATP-dependent sacrificial sulfur transferase LarE [Lactobacillus sp. UCMA15818]